MNRCDRIFRLRTLIKVDRGVEMRGLGSIASENNRFLGFFFLFLCASVCFHCLSILLFSSVSVTWLAFE